MKKEDKGKWSGFLLLESHIGLAVFSLVSLQILPLIIFIHHQSIQRENRLEAYRFSLELASGGKKRAEKKSGEGTYYGKVLKRNGQVKQIKVQDDTGRLLVDVYEK